VVQKVAAREPKIWPALDESHYFTDKNEFEGVWGRNLEGLERIPDHFGGRN
jgi:hypothetical protein